MIRAGIHAFAGKRVLLLQGPLGPFFARLARDLEAVGAEVHKVNFNGGDWLFYPKGAISFRGRMEKWPAFFENLLIERRINVVLLFGDCRPIHRLAHEVVSRRGLGIGVFEEGYLRPDYVTLERYGVNGYSQVPRNPEFYLEHDPVTVPKALPVGNAFRACQLWALLYYLACALLWPGYMRYQHHRPLTLLEGRFWVRSLVRKIRYARREKGIQEDLITRYTKHFFLVPLQVHNDAQIHVHSSFESVAAFINDVVASFACHAPDDTLLVIKHHPMDRGYRDYSKAIDLLAAQHGVADRVRYIHDQHLPTLLNHARGVVLINSTVGLSALHHNAPLKVCGDALYDMPGLTFQGGLDAFWQQAQDHSTNRELYKRFRSYLIAHTQLNGSFYRPLDIAGSHAGLQWDYRVAVPVPNGRAGATNSAVRPALVERKTEWHLRDIQTP